jgi:hypothetical protein
MAADFKRSIKFYLPGIRVFSGAFTARKSEKGPPSSHWFGEQVRSKSCWNYLVFLRI